MGWEWIEYGSKESRDWRLMPRKQLPSWVCSSSMRSRTGSRENINKNKNYPSINYYSISILIHAGMPSQPDPALYSKLLLISSIDANAYPSSKLSPEDLF